MRIHGAEFSLETKGFSHIYDITGKVEEIVSESQLTAGLVNIFVVGSTASVTTMEFEPALSADVRELMERLVPSDRPSRHSQTWGDDNGFSHLRATLLGPGLTVPLHAGRLVLGTWQQIVVIDHDNRPRTRRLFVQVMGLQIPYTNEPNEKKG